MGRKMAVPRAAACAPPPAEPTGKARPRQRAATAQRPARAEPLPPAVSTITGQRAACYSDPVGFSRYTVARLLCNCSDDTRTMLLRAFKRGDQLVAARVPVDALPVVVLLASFLRLYAVALVDDFDMLMERFSDRIKECSHPDKFFASCIAVLHRRTPSEFPPLDAFASINIPALYEELF